MLIGTFGEKIIKYAEALCVIEIGFLLSKIVLPKN